MREEIKIKILQNLLDEITKKYDYFISLREQEYKKTYEMAVKDSLTGFYNRYYLEDYLEKVLQKAERENSQVSLIFMDIDNFKHVNDFFGHAKGDEVMKSISKVIKNHFRSYDIIARYGGDEFVAVIENGKSIEEKLKNLQIDIEKKFKAYGISISYGVSSFPEDIKDKVITGNKAVKKLIKLADIRMYESKKLKKLRNLNFMGFSNNL